MNLNNQQDDTWSPNKMSQYINVKMSIYTPEVQMKWVELQLNGEYIYYVRETERGMMALDRLIM